MIRSILLASALVALGGCAGVSVRQLNYDLSVKRDAPDGAVYYLPKPYLLVTRLPAKAGGLPADFHDGAEPGGGKEGGSATKPGEGAAKPGDGDDKGGGDDAAPAAISDGTNTSYQVQTSDYVLKLIYLPDLTRPMSITARTGLFGSVKLSPTLQDGWMLTAFSSEADSKIAEVLEHLSGVITSIRVPAGKADEAEPGGGGPASEVLKPGLYEFHYDQHGRLTGLCALTNFTAEGVEAPAKGACVPLS